MHNKLEQLKVKLEAMGYTVEQRPDKDGFESIQWEKTNNNYWWKPQVIGIATVYTGRSKRGSLHYTAWYSDLTYRDEVKDIPMWDFLRWLSFRSEDLNRGSK